MNSGNHLKAKVLTLIPVIVLVITVICMVLSTILEVPTSRGTVYTIITFVGLMSMLLSPLPCLVLSIIGTVFAAMAVKEGAAETRKFLVLGIIEILIHIAGVILAVMMLIGSQSV